MNMFIFIPVWVGIIAYMATNSPSLYKTKTVNDLEIRQVNFLLLVIGFLPVFLTVSFAEPFNDLPSYIFNFKKLDPSFSSIDWSGSKGPGFTFIEVIIKMTFGNSVDAFRICIATIQIFPIILLFYCYSENSITSLFLFVSSAYYVAWMMNGLRQFTAAVLVYATLPWIIKKKYIKVILVIILAYTIHSSVLIMIPVIFIVQGSPWNFKTVILIIVIIVALTVFAINFTLFDSAAENFGYSIKDLRGSGDTGSSFLGALFNAIPTIFAFALRKNLDKNNKLLNVLVNMSIINTCFSFMATVTSGILVGRLPGYTAIYNMILYPYLFKNIEEENKQRNIKVMIVIVYIAYYVYQMNFASGLI